MLRKENQKEEVALLFPQILLSSIMKTATETMWEIPSVNPSLGIAFSDCRATRVITRVWYFARDKPSPPRRKLNGTKPRVCS